MFKSLRYLKPPQGYTFILLLGCVVSCLGVTLRDSKGGLGLGSGGSRGGISRGVGGSRIGIPWLFRTLPATPELYSAKASKVQRLLIGFRRSSRFAHAFAGAAQAAVGQALAPVSRDLFRGYLRQQARWPR